ncbi:MAG: hypothetical protein AAGN15_27525 [Cyanobacteria bacterium J06581_3]
MPPSKFFRYISCCYLTILPPKEPLSRDRRLDIDLDIDGGLTVVVGSNGIVIP